MPSKQEISEYYKTAGLVLKPHSQWRLYKIQLYDGRWISLKNQIKYPEQLRKILIKKKPLNVFSSTSAWLNPLNVERPSYKYADRIFLDNLLFIDIDEHNSIVLNAVIKFFDKNPRYKRWKIKDSGNGYGVYYEDTQKIDEPNPKKRLRQFKVNRMLLMLEMAKKGISNFDWRMIIDPFRVSRVIGTLNEGEKICKEIVLPVKDILEEKSQNIVKEITEPSINSTYYCFPFIDSQIYGIKGKHCVHIVKRKEIGYKSFVRILKRLQQIYKLSDFYIFETKKYFSALCLKGVDNIRFVKILRVARASNLNPFIKYGHSWIKTGRSIGEVEDIIEESPVFVDMIENEMNRTHFHSLPHLDYLNSVGVYPKQYDNVFGAERNPTMIAEVNI